ncbi:MAG: phosphoglycerate kinase [Parcubacteria group bacterium]|nr:phosphoglycerate kinase [Parcubacteria group bacterium]
MNKKTIKDIDVKGKKVLMRVDFNVPLSKEGRVEDDNRIVRTLPSIKYLKEQGARIILMSHLGRPNGEVVEELRLEPVGRHLSSLLNEPVLMMKDCIGEEVEKEVDGMQEGDVILLENTRFHKEDKENDKEFAKKLASLADIFASDCFGVSHRAHASIEGVTHFLPSVSGLLIEREVINLSNALENPERPWICLIGGAKISNKIKAIARLLKDSDKVLLGGALVNNILAAKGENIGKSKTEEDNSLDELSGDEVKNLILELKKEGEEKKLYMPQDYIVADGPNEKAQSRISDGTDLKDNEMILDIGPETIAQYKEIINNSKMVIWNGPMGMFEVPEFAKGSYAIAQTVADSNAKSIIGGGETLDLVKSLGLEEKLTFVSTGGGAMLEFLEGKELPGIAALNDK